MITGEKNQIIFLLLMKNLLNLLENKGEKL